MNILAIDTSTYVMGVAILKESQLCGEFVTNLTKNHSVRLMPAIDYLMEEVDMTPDDLDKIVVAKGPGSYTGVRIGLSTAKSLAWALQIPISGLSSLEVLAYQGRDSGTRICPFFDARRGSVFTGMYQWKKGRIHSIVEDQHVDMIEWLNVRKETNEKITFLSPDLSLYKDEIQTILGEQAHFPATPYHIAKPSDLALAGVNQEPDPVHTLAPKYLRLAEAEASWLKKQRELNQNE